MPSTVFEAGSYTRRYTLGYLDVEVYTEMALYKQTSLIRSYNDNLLGALSRHK